MPKFMTKPLDEKSLGLVRHWRNLDHVRTRMATQDRISQDEQRAWFSCINQKQAKHYIYSLGDVDIGSANITAISTENGTFETGIYCGNSKYLGHWVNIAASLFIYDKAFFEFGLTQSTAIILDDNKAALNLNKNLGYINCGRHSDNIGKYILSKVNYEEKSQGIRTVIERNSL
jgi:RimJ/RimL family protein N-acetyltransferase